MEHISFARATASDSRRQRCYLKTVRKMIEIIDSVYDIDPNQIIDNPLTYASEYEFKYSENKLAALICGGNIKFPAYMYFLMLGCKNVFNYYVDIGANIEKGRINSKQNKAKDNYNYGLNKRLTIEEILDGAGVYELLTVLGDESISSLKKLYGEYTGESLLKIIDIMMLKNTYKILYQNNEMKMVKTLQRLHPYIIEKGPKVTEKVFHKLYDALMVLSSKEIILKYVKLLHHLSPELFSATVSLADIPVIKGTVYTPEVDVDREYQKASMIFDFVLDVAPDAINRPGNENMVMLQKIVYTYKQHRRTQNEKLEEMTFRLTHYLAEKGADFFMEKSTSRPVIEDQNVFEMCFNESGKTLPGMKKIHQYLEREYDKQQQLLARDYEKIPECEYAMEMAW